MRPSSACFPRQANQFDGPMVNHGSPVPENAVS
jgi:hypothetical protein